MVCSKLSSAAEVIRPSGVSRIGFSGMASSESAPEAMARIGCKARRCISYIW